MRPVTADEERAVVELAGTTPDVVAAYVFGSRVTTGGTRLSDLDVAFLLDAPRGANLFDRRLTLFAELCRKLRSNAVDVIVLNDAPVELAMSVVRKGRRVFTRDEAARLRFEVDRRIRYIDMDSFRRELAKGLHDRLAEGRFGR